MSQPEPVVRFGEADLSTCDREPIHIPGSIQPHGALLALDAQTLRVTCASANAAEILGVAPELLIGTHLHDTFENAGVAMDRAIDRQDPNKPIHFTQRLTPELGGRAFTAVAFRSAERIVLELEPQDATGADYLGAFDALVEKMLGLDSSSSVLDAGKVAVREVRKVTGFDRVMLYVFDSQWHGHVAVEEKASRLEPFLGLHYPASDIPAQARRLYVSNLLRMIPDIEYAPSPIRGEDPEDPLDLTLSTLRSVSPLHIEYLRNMGVRATVTVSILDERGDNLWGLIACHHYSPKRISHDARYMLQLMAHTIRSQVVRGLAAERDARSDAVRTLVRRLAEGVRQGRPVRDLLLEQEKDVLATARGAGCALLLSDEAILLGQTPGPTSVRQIAETLTRDRLRTECLATIRPEWANHAGSAAGALAVPLGGGHIVWFRGEEIQNVNWAGDPRKAVELTPDGARLSPRKSFEAWLEVRRYHCSDWQRADVEAASELGTALSGLIF